MKNWIKKHKVLTTIIGIVLILIIIGALSPQSKDMQKQTAHPDQAQTTKTKTWQKVIDFSGSANKISDDFTLTGSDARMTYTTSDNLTSIYIMEKGKTLENDGGIPDVMVDKSTSDQTRIVKSPGSYYLNIKSLSSWTVTIEELK